MNEEKERHLKKEERKKTAWKIKDFIKKKEKKKVSQ